MERKCKNCMWWEPTKGQQGVCYGECPAPKIMPAGNTSFTVAWPETPKEARCPKFEEAMSAEEQAKFNALKESLIKKLEDAE